MSGHNSRLRLDTNDLQLTYILEAGDTEDPVMMDVLDWRQFCLLASPLDIKPLLSVSRLFPNDP